MRRRSLAAFATSVAALTVTAAASAGNAGFLPGEAHSPNGHRIHAAFIFVAIFTGIIFLVVEGMLVFCIVKYRRGKRPRNAEGPQIHGATSLEVIWTVIPVLILALIGSFVFYKLPGIVNAPAARAADQTTVDVEGHQFYWLFRYPNGAISINRMVAPADQVVNENIIGLRFDVNHSWWVPDFGPKLDAIPGRTNKTWFKAPAGDYVARCAELCGIQHAHMDGDVHVVPRAEYNAFIVARKNQPIATGLGKEEWQGVCEKCHRLDQAYIGPALGGNPLLADRKALATLLRTGQGNMPAVGRNWTPEQITALVAYTSRFAKAGG